MPIKSLLLKNLFFNLTVQKYNLKKVNPPKEKGKNNLFKSFFQIFGLKLSFNTSLTHRTSKTFKEFLKSSLDSYLIGSILLYLSLFNIKICGKSYKEFHMII